MSKRVLSLARWRPQYPRPITGSLTPLTLFAPRVTTRGDPHFRLRRPRPKRRGNRSDGTGQSVKPLRAGSARPKRRTPPKGSSTPMWATITTSGPTAPAKAIHPFGAMTVPNPSKSWDRLVPTISKCRRQEFGDATANIRVILSKEKKHYTL